MSEVQKLATHPRAALGGRASAKLRKTGQIPAVIYGHNEPVAHVSVNAEEFDRAVRVLHARTFTLDVNGKADTVLIKDVQYDYLGRTMIHVDFERKSLTERVTVSVPVELRNSPKATGGGVIDQPLHVLRVECPLGNIPDVVRIDISDLTLGNPVSVRDLPKAEGITYLDAPDAVVVQLKLQAAEPEAVTDTTGAEPVVLTAKKPKDDEAE